MRSSAVAHPGPTTSWLLYWVARLWMFVFRWETEGEPPQVPKAVVIAAPHTTNWDLPHMLAAAYIFRFKVSWIGKDTLFKPPFGWLMRALGGIPVDRSAPRGQVKEVAAVFEPYERLMIAIPPAGTRKKRPHWKSGFYWIAHTAGVPIVCGYLDYGRRRACLGYNFLPTGDVLADMEKVRSFYADVRGKFPEAQTPVLLKEEAALLEGPTSPSPER